MKVRVDVGDVHGLIAMVCGLIGVLFTTTCMFDMWRNDTLIFSLIGVVLAAFWTSLFALVLRGTWVTRSMAAIGLGCAVFACCIGMTAIAID